jgi:uncharacterized membrane protein YkoI
MDFMRKLLLIAPLLSIPLFISPALAQSCLSQAETRAVIAQGAAMPVGHVNNILSQNGLGQAQSVALCGNRGGYVYNVVAVRPDGRAARVVIDASNGRILSR